MRVLIVEDEFLVRMTLAEALGDDGFTVIEAADGNAALAALRADPSIDLLMTDLALSGKMDGRALVTAIREERPDLPVIYMTGRPERARLEPGKPDMLITKPYSPVEICAAARAMLE